MLKVIFLTIHVFILLSEPMKNRTYNKLRSKDSGIVVFQSENSIVQSGSYLKCKINGKDWAATTMMPDKYVSEIVQIQGSNDNSSLWLQLNKPAPGKTDALIETDLNNWTDEKHNMYMIKTGKTVITKMDDKWIEGTFSFNAQDDRSLKKIEVTNGSFRIPNPKSFNN